MVIDSCFCKLSRAIMVSSTVVMLTLRAFLRNKKHDLKKKYDFDYGGDALYDGGSEKRADFHKSVLYT